MALSTQTIFIFTIIVSTTFTVFFHCVTRLSKYNIDSEPTMSTLSIIDTIDIPTMTINRLEAITYGSFIGIPNFYIKHGTDTLHYTNSLTICSVFSLNLLNQSQSMATNYDSGPLSFAVYIDEDISFHTIAVQAHLRSLFESSFHDISTRYDLYIGLVYVNKSSPFWWQLGFTDDTAMAWKIPVNAMRNLAEYQVQTKWLMTVDIDFELYALNMHKLSYLNTLLRKIAIDYSPYTMFVVPAFAMNSTYVDENAMDYNRLTRNQLIRLIPHQVLPFYFNEVFQECTDYNRWYKEKHDYELTLSQCSARYEPFFIINSNVSTTYRWDSDFTGRQLDKIQRVQYLRYHNFSAVVLRNLFMIHVNQPHLFQNETVLSRIYNTHINNKLIGAAEYCLDSDGPRMCWRHRGKSGQFVALDEHQFPLDFDAIGKNPFDFAKYKNVQRPEEDTLAQKVRMRRERRERRKRNARLNKLRLAQQAINLSHIEWALND